MLSAPSCSSVRYCPEANVGVYTEISPERSACRQSSAAWDRIDPGRIADNPEVIHLAEKRAMRRSSLLTVLPKWTLKAGHRTRPAYIISYPWPMLVESLHVFRPESRNLQRSQSPFVPVSTTCGVGMKSASATAFFAWPGLRTSAR
jgi:hypothetical protein